MFSARKKLANLKFDEWLGQREQQAIKSDCEARYETSMKDRETLMQFLRPDITNAIDKFVDTKTRELSSTNKQLMDKLKREKQFANDYSQKLYDAEKQAATARANHIELQRQYTKLKSEYDTHMASMPQNDSAELQRLNEENRRLVMQMSSQAEEHHRLMRKEQEAERQRYEDDRRFINGQQQHIEELEGIIRALQLNSSPGPPSVITRPPSGARDPFSDSNPSPLTAASNFASSLIDHDTGLKKPPAISDDAMRTDKGFHQFQAAFDNLLTSVMERRGSRGLYDDYEPALLIHIEGKLRKDKTTLTQPEVEQLNGTQISFGYEETDDSYKIFGNYQETYWFLIFYGPHGDYCTNIPGHPGHEINLREARQIEGRQCIIFSVNKSQDIDKQMGDVLSSLKNMGFTALYDMVKRILVEEAEDVKTYVRKSSPHAFASVVDDELAHALELSKRSFEEDAYRRKQMDEALSRSAGAEEEKTGRKYTFEDFIKPPWQPKPNEKDELMSEIQDLMAILNISYSQRATGDYRGWKYGTIDQLRTLRNKLLREKRLIDKNKAQWDTY